MTDKKLNILFLASWYPNKLAPKNGNFIQQHAFATAHFCNVASLYVVANEQPEEFVIEQQTVNDVFEVIVYYKKINSNLPIVSQILKYKKRKQAHLKGYESICKKIGKIDVVHLNVVYPAGDFALYLHQKENIPFLISENWTSLHPPYFSDLPLFIKLLVKRTFKKASMICPVAEKLKESIQKISSNTSFEIVPNVVNTTTFYPKTKEIGKMILHISNLKDEHKNITGILDSIKELSKIRQDFFISIVGDGDYKRFIRYAEKIEIPKQLFKIDGAKSYEEVADLMRTHDVFLLYSNYENLPCVIAEALVCGMPVITSNVGGTAEMINEENGIIIQPQNNKELITKLNTMLDKLPEYNSSIIAEQAANKYSYNKVGSQFLNIYQKLVNQ